MKNGGVSAVVATVLIIFIMIAAITLLWAGVIPIFENKLDFRDLDARVDIITSGGYTFYDPVNKMASVQVKRGADEEEMSNISITFLIGGNTVSWVVPAPEVGSTKVYVFNLSNYEKPGSVTVAPIFVSGSEEKVGSVSSKFLIGDKEGTFDPDTEVIYRERDDSDEPIDETPFWVGDAMTLMRSDVSGRYGCYGCIEPSEDLPGVCADPSPDMRSAEESEDRYCGAGFTVVNFWENDEITLSLIGGVGGSYGCYGCAELPTDPPLVTCAYLDIPAGIEVVSVEESWDRYCSREFEILSDEIEPLILIDDELLGPPGMGMVP